MKLTQLRIASVAAALLATSATASAQDPLGGAFTYQGRLTEAGNPATGSYDIQFGLYDSPDAENPLDLYPDTGPVTVDVQDGLFSVVVEFDSAFFDGEQRWLEVIVERIPLTPRQELTAAPYSLYALSSGDAFGLPFDGNVETSGSAFAVTNEGTGRAAYLRTAASDNANNTLWVQQNGLGGVVYLLTYNAESSTATLRADNNGLGRTAYFSSLNSANDQAALLVDNYGLGRSGRFKVLNSSNATASLEGSTVGTGPGVWGYTTGSGPAVKGQSNGTGNAGYFLSNDSENPNATLYAQHNGLGRVAYLLTNNADSTARTLLADNHGLGRTAQFSTLNSANDQATVEAATYGSGPALFGRTTGAGNAGYFLVNNTDNDEGAILAETSGQNGRAVVGQATDDGSHYNYGGHFTAMGYYGRGVYGEAIGGSGSAVYGLASGSNDASANHGGYFEAEGGVGYGVRGKASSTASTQNFGGYFTAAGASGIGVYGKCSRIGFFTNYGGYFEAGGDNGMGVYARASSASETATNYGGYFYTSGGNGTGVHAQSAGTRGFGVVAKAPGTYGVGIYAEGGSDGYAADFKGNVRIKSRTTEDTIIELGEGLDYAEGFDVSQAGQIVPGTVLIIDSDNPGKLTISDQPYDTRVAGIVAGANGLGSGVRLGACGFDHDVALAGRVYCNVIATDGAVEPGDLLTTSDIPGYAAKVADHQRAQGAVLGKAMERLEKGEKGRVLVLVTLQ